MARVPQVDDSERLIPEAEIVEDLREGGAVITRRQPLGFVPGAVPRRLAAATAIERVVEWTPAVRRPCAHNVIVAHKSG